MSEHSQWEAVRPLLSSLDPIRVENPAHPGTPDVNLTVGWIELKQVEDWPVRPETPLRVEHFTPQQRVWLRRRARAGGRCWMLLKVRQEWLLLSGLTAARLVGTTPRAALIAACQAHWQGIPPQKELLECLRIR